MPDLKRPSLMHMLLLQLHCLACADLQCYGCTCQRPDL